MKIFVKELEFEGKHGVYDEERRDGRRFQVDLEVTIDQVSSATSDELDETLDYRRLAEIITEVAEGPSRYLVEKLAGEIVDTTLERHHQVQRATVVVRKHAPDVVGGPRWVGVELSKSKTDE